MALSDCCYDVSSSSSPFVHVQLQKQVQSLWTSLLLSDKLPAPPPGSRTQSWRSWWRPPGSGDTCCAATPSWSVQLGSTCTPRVELNTGNKIVFPVFTDKSDCFCIKFTQYTYKGDLWELYIKRLNPINSNIVINTLRK